jgi:hypothetical protein
MAQQTLAVAFWFVFAAVLVAMVLLVRQRQITSRVRTRLAAVEARLRAREEEERHLVDTRLPALAEFLNHLPVEVPGPLRPEPADPHRRVLDLFTESVQQATARGEQSAKATLKAMMRAVQSLANEQQVTISTMQTRHDSSEVLEDLLKIDHMNSQLGRRAQATAVLCGSWPGQQRSAASLTDVVRGATSRIRDYLRVRVPIEADIAVASRAVEPVVLAVAELIDNGARHSQPNTSVEVNFQQAHNGMAIMIDDAGVGMTVEELQRAAGLLSGDGANDINRLGDPPQVGFAVIGVLAARYGFRVSVDTRSPYGGVRAVVFLPTDLLTRVSKPAAQSAAVAAQAASTQPPAAAPAKELTPASTAAEELERTRGGLPRRRRHEPVVEQAASTPSAPLPAAGPAKKTAIGLGAWQRGTRSGRAVPPPVAEGNSQA